MRSGQGGVATRTSEGEMEGDDTAVADGYNAQFAVTGKLGVELSAMRRRSR
jgi:hypothetical protein